MLKKRLLAVGAALVMACTPTESQVFGLTADPDSLKVRAEKDSVVLTNPDTTVGPVDTVIVTRTDTVVAVPDSVIVVDTIIEGFDTTFVVDTVVKTDTIVATSSDTTVTVDTVIVADTIRVQTRLVAASTSQSLSDGLTIDSGTTARLTVSAINRLDQPTVPSMVTWLSDAPGTASVTEGVVTGKRPGNANIFAIAQGLSATIPTTVRRVEAQAQPPEPFPEGSQSRFFRAHEPSGMARVTERSFSSLSEGWWYEFDRDGGARATIVSDGGEPHSPSGAIQFNYPQGLQGGRGSINRGIELLEGVYDRIYIYLTFKMDPNWQGHDSGTNKVWYIHHANPPFRSGWSTFFSAGTIDDGPIRVVVEGQEHAEPTPFLRYQPNVGGGRLTRGTWHELEFVLIGNTPGQQNGTLQVWVDGEMSHRYTNVGYFRQGGGEGFDQFQFDAIWGGIGDEKRSDQWLRVGHIYVSGSR